MTHETSNISRRRCRRKPRTIPLNARHGLAPPPDRLLGFQLFILSPPFPLLRLKMAPFLFIRELSGPVGLLGSSSAEHKFRRWVFYYYRRWWKSDRQHAGVAPTRKASRAPRVAAAALAAASAPFAVFPADPAPRHPAAAERPRLLLNGEKRELSCRNRVITVRGVTFRQLMETLWLGCVNPAKSAAAEEEEGGGGGAYVGACSFILCDFFAHAIVRNRGIKNVCFLKRSWGREEDVTVAQGKEAEQRGRYFGVLGRLDDSGDFTERSPLGDILDG